MRPKIRIINDAIGVYNTHQAYVFKIEAFGYHLGTYQHVGVAFFKIRDDLLVTILLFGSVQIHPLNIGVGPAGKRANE